MAVLLRLFLWCKSPGSKYHFLYYIKNFCMPQDSYTVENLYYSILIEVQAYKDCEKSKSQSPPGYTDRPWWKYWKVWYLYEQYFFILNSKALSKVFRWTWVFVSQRKLFLPLFLPPKYFNRIRWSGKSCC